MFVDVHCHLSFPQFDEDRDQVVQRMLDHDVHYLIDPGIDAPSSRKSIQLASGYPFMRATVGLHPHEVMNMPAPDLFDELESLVADPNVVGIGEIGLDYHYPDHNAKAQQEAFRIMLNMAEKHDLPVVIHSRDAWDDTLEILRDEHSSNLRGIMHCFSGTADHAAACIDLGLSISVPGIVTFRKSPLPDVIRTIGLEHLLTETDAPYLAPVPCRGKRNEPALVRYVTARIADIKQQSLETTAAAVAANARTLFGDPA
ncbi:TatD family deoxyribonuclease [Prosthecochloris sp. ZM_2]|uniref:TatD family hydrolase n=1 Tax=Prosthecochloris sp. ZM_2 TaxID=2045206 RepID=UPI000DF7E704|nr:TatD family hydrolase [Prosthecochloris sp. ZM_2]RNA64552.1 TatD family deoxyribonuclease [Prosthecochloris sp. ZM_2]